MSGQTLPGTADDEEGPDRVILHVDMDCFYASCERLREPDLRGEPVVVGMGYEPGDTIGAVATASYEAREFGVDSAQPISQAVERLAPLEFPEVGGEDAPRGHYRPVDMEFYQSVASEVKEILHDCADVVREVSVDEAYLDVTERTSWDEVVDDDRADDDGEDDDRAVVGAAPSHATGPAETRTLAEGLARHVRERIHREVGVHASVGVAPNMATAKVASDHDKPRGLTVVPPGTVAEFLAPLPVEDIHGVGPVRAGDLRSMGVETAGDLAAYDPKELHEAFGDRGRELYDRARGHDDRAVTPRGRPKSLSRESSGTTSDDEEKRETVRHLAADVAQRATAKGALYRTIGIKVVTPPYDVNTRATSLSGPVDDPDLVEEVALDLLTEFEGRTVRKLGVRVSNLSFADEEQASLDGFESGTAAGDEGNRGEVGAAGEDGGDGEVSDDGGDSEVSDDGGDSEVGASGASETGRGRSRSGQFSLGEFE